MKYERSATLHTNEDQDAVEDIQIAQDALGIGAGIGTPTAQVNRIAGIVSGSGDESQLRSMLKDSQLDLDNSRNDVLPCKKTKLDVYASVHPEGYSKFSGSSLSPSDLDQSSRELNSRVHMEEDELGPQS